MIHTFKLHTHINAIQHQKNQPTRFLGVMINDFQIHTASAVKISLGKGGRQLDVGVDIN